jgi:hypothetical protein
MRDHTRSSTFARLRALTLTLALLLAPLLGLAATPAHAATLGVTNTNDGGAGSLRQAIADAAPGDTITFSLPTPSVITLSSELVIAKDLTISGPGAAALTISGNDATRVFFINPGAPGATSGPPAASLAVTISNLTIANGRARGGDGGAADNGGGSGGAAGMGGAVFVNNGNLAISGVSLSANQAQGGNGFGGGVSYFSGAGGGGVSGNGAGDTFVGGTGGGGGALGGAGGGGGTSGTSRPPGSNGGNGAAGGDGGGGGGGGIGSNCPNTPQCTGNAGNGGNGGIGGFGGGGGGGGMTGFNSLPNFAGAIGGIGGSGGFGGGGGGGGGNQNFFGRNSTGGAGGTFGGNGGGSNRGDGGGGGGGAGLGGAIFVRAGSLTLADTSFTNNTASRGNGAQNGQGKGGAIFLLSPASLGASSCTTFSDNSASDAAGSGADTNDIYSGSTPTFLPCDTTAPVIAPNIAGTLGNNGWYTSDVTVGWSVTDAESSISSQSGCDTTTLTSDTVGTTFTCQATSAGGTASQSVTINLDKTAPSISFANRTMPNAAGWNNTAVTVNWTCSDTTSGAVSAGVSQTINSQAANQSATGTCVDNAGNSASDTQTGINIDTTAPTLAPVVSPNPIVLGGSATVSSGAADTLSGLVSQSCGTLDTSSVGNKSVSCTATDTAGNTASAAASYSVLSTFPTTGVLDTFNRANGSVGSSWEGLTGSNFYKIAGNKLDVQVGGPLVWKPTAFGSSQEAFVTLSTIDSKNPSQGVLLKVQTGSVPNSGAISVVYDAKAKAVRVSALRLGQNGAWTLYANQAATFASGDVLGARAKADGTILIYKNGTQVASVTLNAADGAFFNSKGGKIGIWTVAASNAILDDFGGGTVAP